LKENAQMNGYSFRVWTATLL